MRHLFVCLLLFAAWPALAEGPATLGVLAPHIDLEPQGDPWQVTEEQEGLVIANTSEPGRITYYFVQPRERPLFASIRTTATGSTATEELSGAGLLYALQGEGAERLYYLFLLQPDGTTSVLRRDSDGVDRLIATRHPDLDTSRPVELKVVETGSGAAFHVDGERAGAVRSRGIGAGAVGIAAVGQGRFTFRDFELGGAERE